MPRATTRAVLLVCAFAAFAGCGGQEPPRRVPGNRTHGSFGDAPAPRTEAVLAGPLCQGDSCRCRRTDEEPGVPPAGFKRYEVRLGSSDDPLWADVDGMILFKSRERPESCFYVDLKPGLHPIAFQGRAHDPSGLNAAISVAEMGGGDEQAWWYRTFDFQCGMPGLCDLRAIEGWKREIATLAGKHDPCGSTKVQKVGWETGRMPDRFHPEELLLRFTLNVYKFAPENPPGSEKCDRARGE